jgi:hypothetical protein
MEAREIEEFIRTPPAWTNFCHHCDYEFQNDEKCFISFGEDIFCKNCVKQLLEAM